MAGKAAPAVAKTWANTSLATLIDLYILSKQIEGRSAKTLTWYRANKEKVREDAKTALNRTTSKRGSTAQPAAQASGLEWLFRSHQEVLNA
jgi:hypothetical protein